MKYAISIIIFFVFSVFSVSSEPFELKISWDAPYYDVEGNHLDDLDGFNVYGSEDNSFVSGTNILFKLTNDVIASPSIQGTNSNGEVYGERYSASIIVSNDSWYAVTAFDFYGNESDFSPSKFFAADTPKSPTNIYLSIIGEN